VGTPSEPSVGGYVYGFARSPQRITVGSGQKVFGIASMSARAITGQWAAVWAICTRPVGSTTLTSHGGLFNWFGVATQNNAVTANALINLSPGTYDIGPCLAVEQRGRLDYNSTSYTTLLLLNN
jgi:hypothetical protein